jgi:hypothetical protein
VSTPHIEQDHIEAEGIDFVDPCTFTSEHIKIKKLTVLDEDDFSIMYSSTGLLHYGHAQR